MGYVAVSGGRTAIENAEQLFKHYRASGKTKALEVEQIMEQLHLAVDRVMGEGSLYAPHLAALALKQAAGDTLEASFLVRAYRATLPRIGYTIPITTEKMRVQRRISAAFKNIPGGQLLGSTPDYSLRLLDFDLFEESEAEFQQRTHELIGRSISIDPLPAQFPKVVELLRRENLILEDQTSGTTCGPIDITREALAFPAHRSAALQTMARGETGGLLTLAYSNMRGYGAVHPTVGELRVGHIPIVMAHPVTSRHETIGEVLVTEAEIIAHADSDDDGPRFTLGYGLCFGHNETKAIAMAVLDRSIQSTAPTTPSEDQEFVLQHVDGIESMGFCNHYKLPHYVTFQSRLDRIRKSRILHESEKSS
jgi:alpha-D-ribose 1-methylphosphonate 5-triphosphate synthase subunit PhnI